MKKIKVNVNKNKKNINNFEETKQEIIKRIQNMKKTDTIIFGMPDRNKDSFACFCNGSILDATASLSTIMKAIDENSQSITEHLDISPATFIAIFAYLESYDLLDDFQKYVEMRTGKN